MAALGIAIALRAGLWNIGAEGQIYVGATAATAVVLATDGLAFPIPLVLALVAGTVAGAPLGRASPASCGRPAASAR